MRDDLDPEPFGKLVQEIRKPRNLEGLNPISSTLPMRRARCSLTNSNANIAVTTATILTIPWDGETYDSVGSHDNVTNNTRITIPVTGRYSGLWLFHAHLRWLAGLGGYRRAEIHRNGAAILSGGRSQDIASATVDITQDAWVFYDDPQGGDYFEVKVSHDSVGTINIAGIAESFFEAIHLW